MPNVELIKPKRIPTFRKIAKGTWKDAKDPTVYGQVYVDMTEVDKQLPAYQEKHGVKITPAHIVGRAVCHCMSIRPEINALMRFNKIYFRKHAALFYQVNIPGEGDEKVKKANLSGAVLHEAEQMTLAGIANALKEKAGKIKTGQDKEMKKNMNMFKLIPWSLTGLYLDFVSWLLYTLNLDLRFLGVPKDPFGSVMITNIGGLGIDMAWAPLVPYSRVPLLLAVGAASDMPVAENGQVVVKRMLPIGVTFDHRLIDGVHAAQMAGEFKKCFAEPEKYLFNDEYIPTIEH